MTKQQKIDDILLLLTDKNVAILEKKDLLENKEESFGALVFASYAFKKACKIAERKEKNTRVLIEVLGGVAYVKSCPPGVEVRIKDYDPT